MTGNFTNTTDKFFNVRQGAELTWRLHQWLTEGRVLGAKREPEAPGSLGRA